MNTVGKEFKNIAGFPLPVRQTNLCSGRQERYDEMFSRLSRLSYEKPRVFSRICKKVGAWVKIDPSETVYTLAGYCAYIRDDFPLARDYFFEAIAFNPDNLDTWIDLAFALRHCGDYATSNGILFSYEYVIYYYRYSGMRGAPLGKVRELIVNISKRVKGGSSSDDCS